MSIVDMLPWRFRSVNNYKITLANRNFKSVLATAPVAADAKSAVEAHSLLCKRDLAMFLISAKSFLRYCPSVSVVVHDDGSLDDQDERTLRQHITGIKYISRAQSDRELQALLPGPVFAARQANVFMLKLFDYNHFNAGEKTIALDSDLVFTGPPGEILEWMRQQGDTSFYNADLKRDTIRSAHDPRISERVPYFNAGFMGYSGRFTLEELTGICRRLDYFREDQTIYAHLLADKNPSKLPRERYFVYDGVKIPASACMVHFVSDNRFKKSAYIDLARATIGLLGKSAG